MFLKNLNDKIHIKEQTMTEAREPRDAGQSSSSQPGGDAPVPASGVGGAALIDGYERTVRAERGPAGRSSESQMAGKKGGSLIRGAEPFIHGQASRVKSDRAHSSRQAPG